MRIAAIAVLPFLRRFMIAGTIAEESRPTYDRSFRLISRHARARLFDFGPWQLLIKREIIRNQVFCVGVTLEGEI